MFRWLRKKAEQAVEDMTPTPEQLADFKNGLTEWDEWEFDPRPDINAFDLARLIKLQAAESAIFMNGEDLPEWWTENPELQVHFKKTGRTAEDVYVEIVADENDHGC